MASCGDDDDAEPASPATSTVTTTETAAETTAEEPTRAEFIEQADAICEEIGSRLGAIEEEAEAAFDRQDFDAAADRIEEIVQLGEEQTEALQALPRPPGDDEALDRYFTILDQGGAIVQRYADALRQRDSGEANALLGSIGDLEQESESLTAAYGFEECGQQD